MSFLGLDDVGRYVRAPPMRRAKRRPRKSYGDIYDKNVVDGSKTAVI